MRWHHVRALAGAAISVTLLAVAACSPQAEEPVVDPGPSPSSTACAAPFPAEPLAAAPFDVRATWGPDAVYLAIDGTLHVGGLPSADVPPIRSFTVVPTGIVYVEDATADIVWQGWDHARKVIGHEPWEPPVFRGEQRAVVGHPDHDIVAWVESNDRRPGDIVVARPSTGEELGRTARADDQSAGGEIAGVDDSVLHVAFRTDWEGRPVPPEEVWSWRWASGQRPEQVVKDAAMVMDVSAGVWAVDAVQLRFRTEEGCELSNVLASYEDRSGFGSALSPDGRYWFSYVYGVTDVVTGDARPPANAYAVWTGTAELTVLSGPLALSACDATSGACEQVPLELPPGACGDAQGYEGCAVPAY